MHDAMKQLFQAIKDDEWAWMEQMISTHESLVPRSLASLPVFRQASKLAMVALLVPVGAASLFRNLPVEPEQAMD